MKKNVKRLTIAVTLAALGIIIPLVVPGYRDGVISFTPASHVPLFIAMFLGPDIAAMVGLAIGLGFFIAVPPVLISLRAFSHLVWAIAGSFIFKKFKDKLSKPLVSILFSFIIAVIHAAVECLVILPFIGSGSDVLYIVTILFFGGIVHSMLDFEIGKFLYKRVVVPLELDLY